MKTVSEETVNYPILRRSFLTAEDLGYVINKSRSYVFNRFRHPDKYSFTANDQRLLLKELGMENTPENRKKVFDIWTQH